MVHAVVVTFNQTVLQEGNKISYISSNYHISATIPSLYDGHHPTASFDKLLNQYVTIISGFFSLHSPVHSPSWVSALLAGVIQVLTFSSNYIVR